MLKNLISTQIATKEITYQPGGKPAAFEVSVVNQSEQFATFQLDLQAAGSEVKATHQWYRVTPDISSKNPPGDRTNFTIQIIDNPKPGFVGLMNLTVRIFSLELRQEERQILRLILQPSTSFVALKVNLPVANFQSNPGELIQIPVEVENPGHSVAEVLVRCTGIPGLWLSEGTERRVQIAAHSTAKTSFLCQIPGAAHAPSQNYPLVIEASRPQEVPSTATGSLLVLPVGSVQFNCATSQQRLPARRAWLPNWWANQALYPLELHNQSNLDQQVAIALTPALRQLRCQLHLSPDQVAVPPQATAQVELKVARRRPWFGLARTCEFKPEATLADPQLKVENQIGLLRLTLYPVLPLWFQLAGGLALLWLLWLASWLNPDNPWWGHSGPVNTVQFNGVGDRIVSGSDDQSVSSWRTAGFANPFINQHDGKVASRLGKAVRVVRYRPVNNDLIALGLENGEIQLWSVLPGTRRPLQSFVNQADDRVFDLAFTPDSRQLFSGHGSGLVVQWGLAGDLQATQPTVQRQKQVGFAVNALRLVGDSQQYLAIAGRFNQLVLWNLQQDTVRSLKYRPGSESDYILSLATADHKPFLLASADNRGTIKLWNLQSCLSSPDTCEPVDEWTPDRSVRSVAFSADGCYLASAGGDGRTMLWPLDQQGRRATSVSGGWTLDRRSTSINSVDVTRQNDKILVVSGDDTRQVHLFERPAGSFGCR